MMCLSWYVCDGMPFRSEIDSIINFFNVSVPAFNVWFIVPIMSSSCLPLRWSQYSKKLMMEQIQPYKAQYINTRKLWWSIFSFYLNVLNNDFSSFQITLIKSFQMTWLSYCFSKYTTKKSFILFFKRKFWTYYNVLHNM